eukprot:gene24882-38918_t
MPPPAAEAVAPPSPPRGGSPTVVSVLPPRRPRPVRSPQPAHRRPAIDEEERDGYRLEGMKVAGVWQGDVMQRFPNGDFLEGEMVDGRYEGKATKCYAN